MRVFVLRARKGPTAAGGVRDAFGYPDHFEIVTQSVVNALLISKKTRRNVIFNVVLEGRPNPPLTVTFESVDIGSLHGFDEDSLASLFEEILALARNSENAQYFKRGQRFTVKPGIYLQKLSFEALVRALTGQMPVYLLEEKGIHMDETSVSDETNGSAAFLFTDHIPMQKKTLSLLKRLGVQNLSLGRQTLFAAQCITIIHYELDRRGQ